MSIKVGFIGLGSLGAPMARRLAKSGFPLSVYDISPASLEAFDEPGAERVNDPIETARRVDVLGVCVRMDADLIDLTRDEKIFAALGKGGAFIIHSTVAPELCQQLAIVANKHGVDVIDAGISGGAPAAATGELSLFVGGEAQAIARVRPLFDCLGKIAHLGPVGRGMQGKLLNNLVSVANYGMSAAILELGVSLGFDRQQLRDALMQGSAQGFALRAVPGLTRPDGAVAMRQLLGKDVDHARKLTAPDNVDLAALLAAADSMLTRLERIAADAKPS